MPGGVFRGLGDAGDDLDAVLRVEMQACCVADFNARNPEDAIILVYDKRQAVAIEAGQMTSL